MYDLLPDPTCRLVKYPILLSAVDRATPDGPPKSDLARRISEVKGFLEGLMRGSRNPRDRDRDDGSERIAVEDEVVATLNPRSPTALRLAGPRDGSPLQLPAAATVQSPKLQRLHETLHELMEHGLQDFPGLLSFGGPCGEDEADSGGGGGDASGGCGRPQVAFNRKENVNVFPRKREENSCGYIYIYMCVCVCARIYGSW